VEGNFDIAAPGEQGREAETKWSALRSPTANQNGGPRGRESPDQTTLYRPGAVAETVTRKVF